MWGLLFSVIIIVGFFVSSILANLIVYHGAPPSQSSNFVPPLWLGALALTVMPLTIAFAEEGLYRAYLLPRLARFFYFTAENRVDFRELIKDLAAVFRTRIKLRQIGVRDEATQIGRASCRERV